MLKQALDLPPMWRISKLDALVWIVTMLATVFLDVTAGLVVGILMSLFAVVIRTQIVAAEKITQVKDTEVYRKAGSFPNSENENKEVVVLAFRGALHYANKQFFARALTRCSGVDLAKDLTRKKKLDMIRKKAILEMQKEIMENISVIEISENNSTSEMDIEMGSQDLSRNGLGAAVAEAERTKSVRVKCIVIDCGQINFMDGPGVKFLIKMFEDYETLEIKMLLANVCSEVFHILTVGGFLSKFGDDVIFVSVHDAVTWWHSRASLKTNHDSNNKTTRL
nr:solute carrier family 26 member 6-like [Ciona intestinalis]|eukprot:XP_002121793.4 solute carrier family 26 member 6-like [Ciona intestinalis]